jgi:hypothetical protein
MQTQQAAPLKRVGGCHQWIVVLPGYLDLCEARRSTRAASMLEVDVESLCAGRCKHSIDRIVTSLAMMLQHPLDHIPPPSAVYLRSSSRCQLVSHQLLLPSTLQLRIALTLPPHSPHGLRAVVRLLLPSALCCAAYFARTLAVANKTLKAVACACAQGCILDGGHVRCVDCLLACLLACLSVCLLACCLLASERACVSGPGIGKGIWTRAHRGSIKRRIAAWEDCMRHAPYAYTTL